MFENLAEKKNYYSERKLFKFENESNESFVTNMTNRQ